MQQAYHWEGQSHGRQNSCRAARRSTKVRDSREREGSMSFNKFGDVRSLTRVYPRRGPSSPCSEYRNVAREPSRKLLADLRIAPWWTTSSTPRESTRGARPREMLLTHSQQRTCRMRAARGYGAAEGYLVGRETEPYNGRFEKRGGGNKSDATMRCGADREGGQERTGGPLESATMNFRYRCPTVTETSAAHASL